MMQGQGTAHLVKGISDHYFAFSLGRYLWSPVYLDALSNTAQVQLFRVSILIIETYIVGEPLAEPVNRPPARVLVSF